jgi:hypothetical protein
MMDHIQGIFEIHYIRNKCRCAKTDPSWSRMTVYYILKEESLITLQFRLVHLILDKTLNTQSTICTISTYKDIRNFKHAQCNSLMMDTQYPKHVGEEMTTICFMF